MRRLPCLVCGLDDPHGSHGLCGRHQIKVTGFIKRFEIGVPTQRVAVDILYMGLAMSIENIDVMDRVAAMRSSHSVHRDDR
jgi:hypothetical protein